MRAASAIESRRTTCLRNLLNSKDLAFLLAAHDGLSAKVTEEAGFPAIWASGLSIAASLGVRDNNEASWTQVLEVVEFMADAAAIPLLVDGDTGYGNFNSVRRLVRKLEQRGAAGVCIEDKLFPKTNSFIRSTCQPLADADEFAGKIRAAKEAQADDDFVVVARIEALIAGHGMAEALRRGELYRKAGADAVLIHSARSQPDEILEFKRHWGDRLPVVIVPTKYYKTPTHLFREAGFSLVIWANHLVRSALSSMQQTARQLYADGHLMNIEERVAPLAEIFRLQGESELASAEKLYLPKPNATVHAIVLAASRGHELGELTVHQPKCMVSIAGKPLLEHIVAAYRAADVRDITVVRGYKKETIGLSGVTFVDNDNYDTTQELASLKLAATSLEGPSIISYGDVLFRKSIAQRLLEAPEDFVVAVDTSWEGSNNRFRFADYAICSRRNDRRALLEDLTLVEIVNDRDAPGINGEWIGMLKVSERGAQVVRELLDGYDTAALASLKVPDLIRQIIGAGHTVHAIYTSGEWLDVDAIADLAHGGKFA
jgi:phosphoenolpyruvate phosphomutase